MLINGIDLSSLGIILYDRVITSNQVDTKEAWLDGDIQPTSIRQQDSFKSIKLQFLVLGQNEDDAFLKISKLTQLLRKANIKFDDLDYVFNVSMTGKAQPSRLKNGNFVVTYNFTSDYAKGEREIYTTNSNLTNNFRLTILYYKDSTQLISTESMTVRASMFEDTNNSLADIGIDVNKYLPNYYNNGVATNLGGREVTYENLQDLGVLIINYSPIVYNLQVQYMVDDGTGYYNDLIQVNTTFTYPQVQNAQTIGQIIDLRTYKPEGFKANIAFTGKPTVELLLASNPFYVFYEKLQTDGSKTVTLSYEVEDDSGDFVIAAAQTAVYNESQFTDGLTLADIINTNANRPAKYYDNGYIVNHSLTDLITYEDLENTYTIRYAKTEELIYVEYYVGTYPNWYRLTTSPLTVKYDTDFDQDFEITDIGLSLNKYRTNEYQEGVLYNSSAYTTYDSVISAGVLQVYYTPIDYTIVVQYSAEDNSMEVESENVTINALDFLSNPVLSDIINLTLHRPEGYQFSSLLSYGGDVTLAALTQNSPIQIVYEEIEEVRTKNIIVRYKKEMASTFATVNTSLITINEADTQGGVRLRDLFNLNLYKPEYYENGIVDGYSSTLLLDFESLQSQYDVLYMASSFQTPVRYYTDDVDLRNWVGSSTISYRVIDFTVETTLYDLGINVNLYKNASVDNGVIQYTGPINFSALRSLESINVVYDTIVEPGEQEYDYPHRFLFLQHNDLGDYENLHPTWTLNHAYINTGVSVDDMSKLTVIMECARVDNNAPLHTVNVGNAYLFGSSSAFGSYFMRFNNQTMYGDPEVLTGVNNYEAQAGLTTATLVVAEENAIGFSENSGIYAIERPGYSTATFTYSNTLESEAARMPYPLYLFANNNAGQYEGGLAGIGIYSCRIYYNGVLLRDYIPVQFYDLIGDQVAPSNCLYDKVSRTFFEDATHLNSFNIIDDERYTDTNPEHRIGHCFVNYYKGDIMFQNLVYYFRGNDFDDFDAYDKFMVDNYQPSYYKPGVITNYDNISWDFNSINNQTFEVRYEEMANTIQVNYYKEDSGVQTLLATETIGITERDFLSAPTFGDLIRINKYKPSGYETDFEYQGAKVTLSRIIDNAPYNIVYKPIEGTPETYSTLIRYIKKVYGVRTYEIIDTITLTFDQSDFRDGEYLDYYVNFNLKKPANYYSDGEPYQWYLMDERLDSPDKLKEMYTIVYNTVEQFLTVNYYTDDWDPLNLVASTTWGIKLDDFEANETIYLVDTLPNSYINKYKPANGAGGVIQNASTGYTFAELAALSEIAIVYDSISEPHDPETASYEQKVLYWGDVNSWNYFDECMHGRKFTGGKIPWIDLGYKPAEIGRLRVELTGYARPYGISGKTSTYSYQAFDYLYFFGYYGPVSESFLGAPQAYSTAIQYSGGRMTQDTQSTFSPGSDGAFAIRCRLPIASGWVYTAEGPQYIDNQILYAGSAGVGVIPGDPELLYTGIEAGYRKGYYADSDENYNEFVANSNYIFSKNYAESTEEASDYVPCVCWNRDSNSLARITSACGNPYTIILDAYNKYGSVWRVGDSNDPYVVNFDESGDEAPFETLCRPKGSLSLFQTTNPASGQINVMPFNPVAYPYTGVSGSIALSQAALGNPYSSDYSSSITTTQTVVTGFAPNGDPIYQQITTSRNLNFAGFALDVFPQMTGCAIWGIKIYDQDRLVRHLIPVAEGDHIYDYVMPANGLFDLVTEIFFTNGNQGGTYEWNGVFSRNAGAAFTTTIQADEVYPLHTILDPLVYGKTVTNYYDYDNIFINNQYVDIPCWYNPSNEPIEDVLRYNDFKPDDFHLDGMLDLDADLSFEDLSLLDIYNMGSSNVLYKLRTFTKTIVYYRDNVRVGSRDLFYSLEDIENASTLDDLGIDLDLYYDANFDHGRVVFDESILSSDDIQAFIDAPSPIVVYDKLSQQDNPDLLYVEYYRGGASDDSLITINPLSSNYLDCDLTGVILNPHGAIKYMNHYHQALYEDESFDYFIPYQVRVLNRYTGIHRGPARKYPTLAMIVDRDVYTITEERNGWGRLREYPNGWILLNQTEPIAGPGQNPEYDEADDDVATIPFGEEVNITMLTIDRLWCYVPEVESWIKAEDVSYNQAGKLYNGLAIEVIDLSEVDFTQADSLSDVGVDINKYKLKFHNNSSYTYTGNYTYSDFSDLHDIEIVYPETIYVYSCIYYRYTKDPLNELGRSGFTCTISDWNPDWDTFLATSYQHQNRAVYGVLKTTAQDHQYVVVYSDLGTTVMASLPGENVLRLNGALTYKDNDDLYGYYPVLYNGEQGYVKRETSHTEINDGITVVVGNNVVVVKPYLGVVEEEVMPTLYRDTELTLDWDYFGFDRNLYKPTGTGDGIYLWNPRSWDPDNIQFTFKELVSAGTQYVVYPSFEPGLYKLWVKRNWLGYYDTEHPVLDGLYNPGLKLDLSGSTNIYNAGFYNEDGYYDIYSSGEVHPWFEAIDEYGGYRHVVEYPTKTWNGRAWLSGDDLFLIGTQLPYLQMSGGLRNNAVNANQGDVIAWNVSNYRNGPTVVLGVKENEPKYYTLVAPADYWHGAQFERITSTMNLQGRNKFYDDHYPNRYFLDDEHDSTISVALNYDNSDTDAYTQVDPSSYMSGVLYDTIVYQNFMMIHYWTPVPQGLWYYWNGEWARVPDNGMLDLLTGEFARSYRLEDGLVNGYQPTRDGQDVIFLRSDRITGVEYIYQNDWYFNTSDCSYWVKVNSESYTYKVPDAYSTRYRTIPQNAYLYVTKYTSDSANNVVGEWYLSGDEWIQSSNCTIVNESDLLYGFYGLREAQQNMVLVPLKEDMTNFYGNKHPTMGRAFSATDLVGSQQMSYGDQPQVLKTFYTIYSLSSNADRWYFDGQSWIPMEQTSKNTQDVNANYVVAESTICYSLPIENVNYRLSTYNYGDRITVLKSCVNDDRWCYTGEGWIRNMGTNLSIIE